MKHYHAGKSYEQYEMNLKRILRQITPPIFFNFLKGDKEQQNSDTLNWYGEFKTWEEAVSKARGYDDEVILHKVKSSMLKVQSGEAVYERDAALFDEVQYSWPLVSFLLKAALENRGNLNVVDFGGSLGSSYFQNREILNIGDSLKWNIVEQKHFVDCGKANFENESLKFYYDLETCLKENTPDILLLSGVLQYLKDPYQWISIFNKLKFKYLIIDRTAFVDSGEEIIKIQQTTEAINYPVWFFNKQKFISAFGNYEMLCEFQDYTTSPVYIDSKYCYWSGLIFSGS